MSDLMSIMRNTKTSNKRRRKVTQDIINRVNREMPAKRDGRMAYKAKICDELGITMPTLYKYL